MDKYLEIFGLIGATVVGGFLTLFGVLLTNINQVSLEKIKLHEKDKCEAYKKLYSFVTKISNATFPLSVDKQIRFEEIMKADFSDVQNFILYYSEDISKILEEFESAYVCMTETDLIPDTEDFVDDFIHNKVYDYADKLKKLAKRDFKKFDKS
jgi:hypothetical protein